jgi:hypothetical protein
MSSSKESSPAAPRLVGVPIMERSGRREGLGVLDATRVGVRVLMGVPLPADPEASGLGREDPEGGTLLALPTTAVPEGEGVAVVTSW